MLSPNAILQNRYQIIREIGNGGFGAVYLAYDQRFGNRLVVVKENQGGDPLQFQTEANILGSLNHPNLPRVFDHFSDPTGAQFLVMDYIEGQNLETIMQQRGALRESDALGWIRQILDAVEYLHQNRIIHRDIKPQNIIITPQNRAVLVDFGIAKRMVTGRPTQTGARAATPGFSAPEQYAGGTSERSDIYSLCATLYALLTTQVPPEAPTLASGSAQLIPPTSLNRQITPQTEHAILRGMSIQAPLRFQSVGELRSALAGQLVSALPLPIPTAYMQPQPYVPTQSRNPVTVLLSALFGGLILLGICGIGALVVFQLLNKPAPTPTAIAFATTPRPITAPATIAPPVMMDTRVPTRAPDFSATLVPTIPPSSTRTFTPTPSPTIPLPPSSTFTPIPPRAVTTLEDDFGFFDTSKWVRDNNTGNSATVSGGVLQLSSSGTRFPYIYTRANPIPTSGNFRVTQGFRYTNIGVCGAPLAMASFFIPAGVSQDEANRISSTAERNGGMSIWFWHEVVYYRSGADKIDTPLPGGYTSQRQVTVEYVDGRYTISSNGTPIFISNFTKARPQVIWFGNAVDIGTGLGCNWDSFEVDNIKVESLP